MDRAARDSSELGDPLTGRNEPVESCGTCASIDEGDGPTAQGKVLVAACTKTTAHIDDGAGVVEFAVSDDSIEEQPAFGDEDDTPEGDSDGGGAECSTSSPCYRSRGPAKIVRLNIGGHVFITTEETLLGPRGASSFFSGLLSRNFAVQTDADGNIFIDRDGQYFPPILSYLRTGQWHVPLTMPHEAVLEEARFYGIDPCENTSITDVTIRTYLEELELSNAHAKYTAHAPAFDHVLTMLLSEFRQRMAMKQRIFDVAFFACSGEKVKARLVLDEQTAQQRWQEVFQRPEQYYGRFENRCTVYRLQEALRHYWSDRERRSRSGSSASAFSIVERALAIPAASLHALRKHSDAFAEHVFQTHRLSLTVSSVALHHQYSMSHGYGERIASSSIWSSSSHPERSCEGDVMIEHRYTHDVVSGVLISWNPPPEAARTPGVVDPMLSP